MHRDLKPANVLLDPKGQAKLCDFVSAWAVTSSELSAGCLFGGWCGGAAVGSGGGALIQLVPMQALWPACHLSTPLLLQGLARLRVTSTMGTLHTNNPTSGTPVSRMP